MKKACFPSTTLLTNSARLNKKPANIEIWAFDHPIHINFAVLKRILLFVVLMISIDSAYCQKSIDALFEKYAGNEGFTSLTLNGDLLKFADHLGGNNGSSMPADISEIRILTQEDKNMTIGNFYDMVIKDIDLNLYEEFMSVKEKGQDLRMLVRAEGNNFKEFLLIAGGKDNALIQIKGNMSKEEAEKFSNDARKNHDSNGGTEKDK